MYCTGTVIGENGIELMFMQDGSPYSIAIDSFCEPQIPLAIFQKDWRQLHLPVQIFLSVEHEVAVYSEVVCVLVCHFPNRSPVKTEYFSSRQGEKYG